MPDSTVRLIGVMTGDLKNDHATRIKYSLFFDALAKRFSLVDVYDASLKGGAKLWNAALVFHPNPTVWKKRYWINLPAYHARSRLASKYLAALKNKADVAIQIGAIFDANIGTPSMPTVIYTDYTVKLSTMRPEAGRAPFTPAQMQEWLYLEKLAYQRAAHVFTRASFVRDSIIADYGISSAKVTAIGGGINFNDMPEAVSHSKDESPVVLFIGRDLYRKGGDLMLEAFARARRACPSARLLFLTRDPIPDGFSLDGVEIISAKWDREKIKACFRRANIFVLPSRLETWGDVLLEAMAYGLACIGMDVAPMTEILDNGKTGFLVQPENADVLCASLLRLFEDGELRCRLGQAARVRAQNFHTWDQVIARMFSVIHAIGVLSRGD